MNKLIPVSFFCFIVLFINFKVIISYNDKEFVENSKKLYLNDKYIQLVRLAEGKVDTKSIVDRPTKRPIEEVLHALNSKSNWTESEAQEFVDIYLNQPGYEIYKANLTEWNESPEFINLFKSNELKEFGLELNRIWRDLYKGFKFNNQTGSSHLPMKNEFVVVGGRFREMYYWDTYWTLEGLLVCDLHQTVFKMLENFIFFIDQYGFIPNGSRVYYLNRSQPPYFAHMVLSFFNYSINSKKLDKCKRKFYRKFVLRNALNYLIKEHEYWMSEKLVTLDLNGKNYKFNQYRVVTTEPRPESYFEDIDSAKNCVTEECKIAVYVNKASAAESGYDFSSRWFTNPFNIETIETTNIIPVDLNAILYKNERIIAYLCTQKGDRSCALKFNYLANERKQAINTILWSEGKRFWSDYNINNNSFHSDEFYVSNLSPLWMDILPPNNTAKEIIDYNIDYLTRYDGGIPVSFINSTEQWDFPNVWAPNQHSTILMLAQYDKDLGLLIAKNFFNSVYKGWQKYGLFYEKYDAQHVGERGFGGEYEVQSGFGWTNGAILSILKLYRDELLQ